MRGAWDFALQSDPALNPQFRRGYRWFPPPGKRNAGLEPGASDDLENGNGATLTIEQLAQQLAARWGVA